jgi:hypothetical protein
METAPSTFGCTPAQPRATDLTYRTAWCVRHASVTALSVRGSIASTSTRRWRREPARKPTELRLDGAKATQHIQGISDPIGWVPPPTVEMCVKFGAILETTGHGRKTNEFPNKFDGSGGGGGSRPGWRAEGGAAWLARATTSSRAKRAMVEAAGVELPEPTSCQHLGRIHLAQTRQNRSNLRIEVQNTAHQ